MKIKKGDKVKVLLGKDRGKIGSIEYVLSKERKIMVTSVNTYKRHVRKQGDREGGIINIVKPINISNVMLICPTCQKPTRVGFVLKGASKIRICKKCKKEINQL